MIQINSAEVRHDMRSRRWLVSVMKAVAREPLVHFMIFGSLFLVSSHFIAGSPKDPAEVIVVTGERIEQIHALLAQSLQRPPTEEEVKAAIDDYVKEEIYYREAKKLGLDEDDTVIRRRLRQKMEFLGDVAAEEAKPTEAELQGYLEANKEKFTGEASLAFQQVFLSVSRRGEAASSEALMLLTRLTSKQGLDFTLLGDSTSLPAEMALTPISVISGHFGAEFTGAVERLQPGTWSGPITTSFGLHLVRVTERREGTVPDLASVRTQVAREWAYTRRAQLEGARFAEYLKNYQVKFAVGNQAVTP